MKRRTQLQMKQLGAITAAWLVVGLLIAVYDHLVLHTGNSQGTAASYSFQMALAMNLGSAIMGSLLGGSLLVFYVNVKYVDKPYGYTIAVVALAYIAVMLTIILVLGVTIVPAQTGRPVTDSVSRAALKAFLMDTSRLKATLIWSIVVGITQLLLQINSKFGQGVFGNIIRGKYNTPKEENRIFMFLDMNSSTSIAEQLGNEKYHDLLKDFFADITNPVLDNNGEIYQYVGDEVIVAWKYEDGIRNNQCVQCFFDIKKQIENQKEKYLRNYGIVPSFKAGIHHGNVVAGEVGIIKRDITYSGDVLNTTSRIMNMCKEFKAEIISSADLLASMGLGNYHVRPLGSIKLRGKGRELLLSALG